MNYKKLLIEWAEWSVIALIVAVSATLLLSLISCSPRVVTVPEYHYESHHSSDTVFQRDSVMKEQKTVIREADSTMLAELGIRLRDGERAILVLQKELQRVLSQQKEAVHDTVCLTDSIRVPYPVEKKLSRWQDICISFGGYAIGTIIALLLLCLILMYYRWKKL